MYCPKCKENFEEQSRRFCPNDGSRLVREEEPVQPASGGIFSNLVAKMEGQSATSSPATNRETSNSADDFFFEIEDPATPSAFDPFASTGSEPIAASAVDAPARPARKVNIDEVPPGHVELGGYDPTLTHFTEFNFHDPESFVGRVVKGRYKVTEFLGGDDDGLAYLGHDRIFAEKKVLVRILLHENVDNILKSILAEERVALSHFSHPNVARMIDSGEFANGTIYIVSEFIDSLSVADLLSIHGYILPLRAARIVRQAASALAQAHQEGILHRDIRPQNLIVDGSGDGEHVKLVNFGASSGDATPQNYLYKAPEVLDGRVATASGDIYSLAIVAYEMLTGRLPFEGATEKELVRSQVNGPSLRVAEIRTGLPKKLDTIFAKGLAYTAAERYSKARDFGDAFYAAIVDHSPEESVEHRPVAIATPVSQPTGDAQPVSAKPRTEILQPLVPVPQPAADGPPGPQAPQATTPSAPSNDAPAWTNRSFEPPQDPNRTSWISWPIAAVILAALVGGAWYLFINSRPAAVEVPNDPSAAVTQTVPQGNPAVSQMEMPPLPRNIPQPPNTVYYQNSKENLRGELLRNFVGFTMYYPKDWKVNDPQPSNLPNVRSKFLDISESAPNGMIKEQMLVSYYPSKGTFDNDKANYPQLVKETNETLRKILPGYEMVSQGEVKINGEWRAYEVKFQASGTGANGEPLTVWGRRLFVPAHREGARNGFELTMLATSLSDEVRGVDDIGVKGDLSSILYTFEPSQNF